MVYSHYPASRNKATADECRWQTGIENQPSSKFKVKDLEHHEWPQWIKNHFSHDQVKPASQIIPRQVKVYVISLPSVQWTYLFATCSLVIQLVLCLTTAMHSFLEVVVNVYIQVTVRYIQWNKKYNILLWWIIPFQKYKTTLAKLHYLKSVLFTVNTL